MNHVGFIDEVDVDLHGRGAKHHVKPVRADFRHIGLHDRVALLGHRRRFRTRPFRACAQIEETNPERARHRRERSKMRVEFVLRGVNGGQRRAGQFELSAGLQRNGADAMRIDRGR